MRLLADYAHSSAQTNIVVITHTLNTIDECDETIFIENGQLRAVGTTQSVLSQLEKSLQPSRTEIPLFQRWARVFAEYHTREETRIRCSAAPRTLLTKTPSREHLYSVAPWRYQVRTLLSRYMKTRLADSWSFVLTLASGLSGLLFFILPDQTFVMPKNPSAVALGLVFHSPVNICGLPRNYAFGFNH